MTDTMKQIKIINDSSSVVIDGSLADGFITRFRGLMFKKSIPDGWGLMIVPCNQIHMFNMRFPIDVVYISKEGKIVFIDKNVPKGKVCKAVKQAHCVLELNAGTAEGLGLNIGNTLTVQSVK